MMEEIIKQNTFSRTVFNDSKLGAYYTDPVHAEDCSDYRENAVFWSHHSAMRRH